MRSTEGDGAFEEVRHPSSREARRSGNTLVAVGLMASHGDGRREVGKLDSWRASVAGGGVSSEDDDERRERSDGEEEDGADEGELALLEEGGSGSGRAVAVGRGVRVDERRVPPGGEFGGPGLGLVVDVDEAEALGVAVGPLVVVEEGPGVVGGDPDALGDGARDLLDVGAVVVDAEGVVEGVAGGELEPGGHGEAVLGDAQVVAGAGDGVLGVPRGEPDEEVVDALGDDVEPLGAGLRADRDAVVVVGRDGEHVVEERNALRRGRGGVRGVGDRDPAGRVVVDAEEVDRAAEGGGLLRGEGGHRAAYPLLHGVRVVTVDDGVEEPRPLGLEEGLVALGVRLAERVGHVAAVGHPDLVVPAPGEASAELGHGGRVGQEDVVTDDDGFQVGVALGAPFAIRASAGSVDAVAVALADEGERLVEGEPALGEAAEGGEGHVGEGLEVADDRLVAPAAVLVLERLRDVPVVERHERLDARLVEEVENRVVEVEPGRVEGGAPALRQEPRPRQREAVVLQAEVLHQFDVVREAMVVVVRDIASFVVVRVKRDVREGVPYRGPAPALRRAAFDLIRRCRRAPREVGRKSLQPVGEGEDH
mmetsp:Transcript_10759/g.34423  ORF Transcript_10759/g.34423 Transcript_10759/m.34423 type:complete len:593 (-) Transcript_10759:115-1893(-)